MGNNKIKRNKIKQKLTQCNWIKTKQKEKGAREGTRNADPFVCTLRNAIHDTKLEAMIHMQRTWCRPMQAVRAARMMPRSP